MLDELSTDAQLALETLWRIDRHDAGALIIGEGDDDCDLFFVLEGEARAAAFTLNGREVAFTLIRAGDCFGEIAAIDRRERTTSVVALTPMETARLPGSALQGLTRDHPDVAWGLLRLLAGKLRRLTANMIDYAELTSAQRIRRELARLARDARTGLDAARIETPPNQAEIATRAYTRREAVAREMATLRRAGLVLREGRMLIVPSIRRLEAAAVLE